MVNEHFHPEEKPHSLLGFGMMRLPVREDGSIDEPMAVQMVELAFKSGVNYFDTAYGYHESKSEGFVKKALAPYPRESYFLADKMPMWLVKEESDLERLFAEQLERCGTGYFDYYLAHALNKETTETLKRLDVISFFKRKKEEGKIRHIGFSFHDDLDCFREILSLYDWEFCQLQLNYADWNRFGAKDFYQTATDKGVPVIVMEPVRGGFLADPPQEVAELLGGADAGRSMASWAFRYVASLPNVKLILSGMTAIDQVEDNLRTFADTSVYLSHEEKELLDRATKILDGIHTVPCTACRYCMPCPAGVEIPAVFGCYNTAKFLKRGNGGYQEMAEETKADRCVSCGACVSRCPQHIQVPERLAEAHALLSKEN